MSSWGDDEFHKLLSVRANTGNVRQIRGMARHLVVYEQITNWVCDCCVLCIMSCLLHALPRHHLSLKPNKVFLNVLTLSDTLLLFAACVKGKLRTMTRPDSPLSGVHMRKQLNIHSGAETIRPS